MSDQAQESKRELVGAKVTKSEKDAVDAVRLHTGVPTSDLLRVNALDDLIAWGRRLQAKELIPA